MTIISKLFIATFLICLSGHIYALRVGIIGDQTGTLDINQSYQVLAQGCTAMSEMKPDIVIHIGDLVESSMSDYDITTYFNTGSAYLDSIGHKNGTLIPWYLTAGDHDVNPPDWTPGTTDYSKENLFHSLLQKKYNSKYDSKAPLLGDSLYYSFDFDGYHIIILFSEETLRVDPRWGDIFMAKISSDQYSWLENDLAQAENSKGILIFIHQPLWYNWTAWMKVHNLLKNYNVLAVVAGHYHYSQNEGEIDGIKYLVVSATGGLIKDAPENSGGMWAVTVLDIDENSTLTPRQFPVGSDYSLKFTSRENMDRVQALSSMISSLDKNDTSSSDNLFGNPIDLPVDIYLSSSDDTKNSDWKLYKTYQPGQGVIMSNLSSVTLYNSSIPTSVKGVKIIFKDEQDKEAYSLQQFWTTNEASTNKSSLTLQKHNL